MDEARMNAPVFRSNAESNFRSRTFFWLPLVSAIAATTAFLLVPSARLQVSETYYRAKLLAIDAKLIRFPTIFHVIHERTSACDGLSKTGAITKIEYTFETGYDSARNLAVLKTSLPFLDLWIEHDTVCAFVENDMAERWVVFLDSLNHK